MADIIEGLDGADVLFGFGEITPSLAAAGGTGSAEVRAPTFWMPAPDAMCPTTDLRLPLSLWT